MRRHGPIEAREACSAILKRVRQPGAGPQHVDAGSNRFADERDIVFGNGAWILLGANQFGSVAKCSIGLVIHYEPFEPLDVLFRKSVVAQSAPY